MYDEAWYNSFVPKSNSHPSQPPKPQRLTSLLKQPEDVNKAVDSQAEVAIPPASTSTLSSNGPPPACVARRARSYTDFYYAARAHFKAQQTSEIRRRYSRDSLFMPKKAPQTALDLNRSYQHMSDDILDASHDRYRLHRDQLRLTRRHLDSLVSDTNANLDLLASIASSFNTVDLQTSVFQSRSDGLLSEQKRLSSIAERVGNNLQYYNYLEPITRRLNAPGAGNFVRGDDFSEMLSNLDNCLEYMKAHPTHRESAIYMSKYRLLLTRALTLIRVHFTNTLREIAADASKRISNPQQLNDTTLSSLLYAKFRVSAPELKRLGLEIQKRAVSSPDADAGSQPEYQSLVNELYQSYTAARGRLILPIITKKMAELASASNAQKDLVVFARSSISYMRGICLDEHDLWREWFEGDGGLYEFLEAMCEPLFDQLRPRTIRETELLRLCEVCTLLQTRYMDNSDEESEIDDVSQLDFGYLIRPALEDAQTRLVFLSLTVLRNGIERFKPKPEDLDYPARNRNLLAGGKIKSPVLSGRKNSISTPLTPTPKTPIMVEDDETEFPDLQWGFNVQDSFQGWYPSLRKAIWLLSRIYRLVNSSVFDDLAHQIVHQTTLSLYQAATQISTKATSTDGQLFLLQHLLILKQQIVAFDIEFVTPEVAFDFSNVSNTFWELRERGGLFNPINVMRAISGGGLMPRVVENMLDAKAELDARLRTVIKDFTNEIANRLTAAISEGATKEKGTDSGAAVTSVRMTIEKEIPALRNKLGEYLDDTRTKETLMGAVQTQVIQNYEQFFERHGLETHANGRISLRQGKGGEDDVECVEDVGAFSSWIDVVFGVERFNAGADEEVAGDNVSATLSDIESD